MQDGRCSKDFPKPLCAETVANENGYPRYRQRDDGTQITVGWFVDCVNNSMIVPYNAYLLLKYMAHINVKAIKYLCMYVLKGYDSACIELWRNDETTLHYDEINMYLNVRYVSAPEAMWRIFSFEMDKHSHTITQLAVHCEDAQNVVFTQGAEADAIRKAAEHGTTLMAYFVLNCHDENACQWLYQEIPNNYVFNKNVKPYAWKSRQRGGDKVIACMFSVGPSDIECFHLRHKP
jgi:ATP-dependent DNA helicase PIF1